MTIQEAIGLFKNLLASATKKREIRIYKHYLGLLSGLKQVEFTVEEQEQLQTYLKDLQLKTDPTNRSKYLSKKYYQFTQYLQNAFGLVTEGYYSGLSISLGLSLGAGLGVTFGVFFGGSGVSLGVSFGAGIGLIIGIIVGTQLDQAAKEKGKVISTTITDE